MTETRIDQDWLEAAVDLQIASTDAGSSVIALEKRAEGPGGGPYWVYCTRTLRLRLEALRTLAKQAQRDLESAAQLEFLTRSLDDVGTVAQAVLDRLDNQARIDQ